MNQQCKVCGEPAAGFHFGAFTCEGCKVRETYEFYDKMQHFFSLKKKRANIEVEGICSSLSDL